MPETEFKKVEIEMEDLPDGVMIIVERDPQKVSNYCQTPHTKGRVVAVEAITEGNLTRDSFIQFCPAEKDAGPISLRIGAFIENENLLVFLKNMTQPVQKLDFRELSTPIPQGVSLDSLVPKQTKEERGRILRDRLIGYCNHHIFRKKSEGEEKGRTKFL